MAKLSKHHQERIRHRKKVIQSYRSKADARRTPGERFADLLTTKFGSVTFLVVNAIWFATWIILNTNIIPGLRPFDEFPFGLLTMVVSLEAIFLAIIVLISQNRAAKVAEIREEVDLQINTMSEVEVTQTLKLMILLLEKSGIDASKYADVNDLLKPLNSNELEKALESQLT